MSSKKFTVKLKRSTISCTRVQKETVRCLGLRKIGSQRTFEDSPTVRGQIKKVQHLVEVQVQK